MSGVDSRLIGLVLKGMVRLFGSRSVSQEWLNRLAETLGEAEKEYRDFPEEGKGLPPSVWRAIGWLQARLANGPAQLSKLREEAEALNEPIRTVRLYEAAKFLKVKDSKQLGKTWWELPACNADQEGA